MEIDFYEQQMKRLKDQWPNAYSKERMMIFFNAFRNVSNFDFRDAVTDCLATARSAPLLPELTLAIEKARLNYFNQKRIDETTQQNAFLNIPDDGTCDREFKDKCVDLYQSYMSKKITREQFFQGCDLLDQAAKLYKNKNNSKIITPKQLGRPYKDDDEKPY